MRRSRGKMTHGRRIVATILSQMLVAPFLHVDVHAHRCSTQRWRLSAVGRLSCCASSVGVRRGLAVCLPTRTVLIGLVGEQGGKTDSAGPRSATSRRRTAKVEPTALRPAQLRVAEASMPGGDDTDSHIKIAIWPLAGARRRCALLATAPTFGKDITADFQPVAAFAFDAKRSTRATSGNFSRQAADALKSSRPRLDRLRRRHIMTSPLPN